MSHTPGPWKAVACNDFAFGAGASWMILADEPMRGRIDSRLAGMKKDDAQLIAAAPELLAVMKEAELDCRGYEALHGWVEKAVAAIAKAEGAQ